MQWIIRRSWILVVALVIFCLVKSPIWTVVGLVVVVLGGWALFNTINKRINRGSLWPFFKQPESTLAHVVRGGQFCRACFSMPGYHVQNGWIVEGDAPEPRFLRRFLGNLQFVSVFRHVVLRRKDGWKWINPSADGQSFEPRKADVVFWPTKEDTYGATIECRDRHGVAFKVRVWITLRIVHVTRPFFLHQNWLERTIQEVQGGIGEYFADHGLLEFMQEQREMSRVLYEYMRNPDTGAGDRVEMIRERVGISFSQLRIAGAPELRPEDQAAFQSQWTQERLAEAEQRAAEVGIHTAENQAEAARIKMAAIAEMLTQNPGLKDILVAQAMAKEGGASVTDLLLIRMLGERR